jgi:CheY-like chemotaxis protein
MARAAFAASSSSPAGVGVDHLRSGATALAGARILVIDDDPDMQRLLSLVFSHAGAVVLASGSPSSAIEAFDGLQPQLVVSDLELPEMNGFDLIRLIRSLPRGSGGKARAILLTGNSNRDTPRRARLAGFDATLCKPVMPLELLNAACSLL